MSNRKDAGNSGEDAALEYLKQRGLTLVTRNFRCRAGEIDLVMLHQGVLVVIEVRYRESAAFGGAAASVGRRKQRRIIIAAQYLLATRADLRRYPARFDVVAVEGAKIEWIRNAFTL